MMRRVSNLAAGVSAALLVIVFVFWIRSYGLTDQLIWRNARGERWVRSAQGDVVVSLSLGFGSDKQPGVKYLRRKSTPAGWDLVAMSFRSMEWGDRMTGWDRAGFKWSQIRNVTRRTLTARGAAPFWALAVVTGVVPLLWVEAWAWRKLRARRRRKRGLCVGCGYDLRAMPQGETQLKRCPECGRERVWEKKRATATWRTVGGGFAAAIALTSLVFVVFVIPISNQHVRDGIETDVYDPLSAASYYSYESAANGNATRAAGQLKMLNERFAAYQNAEGAPPKDWWGDVVHYGEKSTTKP